MQITVNSKYEIGQQVYLCKTKLKFKDGDFVNDSNAFVCICKR